LELCSVKSTILFPFDIDARRFDAFARLTYIHVHIQSYMHEFIHTVTWTRACMQVRNNTNKPLLLSHRPQTM